MLPNVFDPTKYLNKYNLLLQNFYPEFGVLSPEGKNDIHIIRQFYRDKINETDNDDEKMILNMGCEYFESSQERTLTYNKNNLSQFKKVVTFSPNLLVIMNDLEGLKEFFKSERDKLNKVMDDRLRSILYVACKCGYKQIVIFLLEQGAISDSTQISGSTPLHAACYYRHKEIVELLLQVGSNLNVKNKFNNLPENETNGEIKRLIKSFKDNKPYNLFLELKPLFGNVKLVINDDEIVGKRCSINESKNKTWDLAWQGTELKDIKAKITNKFKVDSKCIIEDNENDRPEDSEGLKSSDSVYYATTRSNTEHFKYFRNDEWLVVIECRLKPNSYESNKTEIKDYQLNINETSALVNTSSTAEDILISAVWFFNKNFILMIRDHSTMIEKIKEYIP